MATNRATLKDVAERSGYALRTVKNVVAGKSTVGTPVREAVLQAMKELNYKPNSLASSLARNQSFRVAVVLLDHDSAHQQGLLRGLRKCEEQYADFGLSIRLQLTANDAKAQAKVLEEFYEDDEVDGVLLQCAHTRILNQQIDLLTYNEKPVVTFDNDAPDSKRICFVGPNYIKSGRVAAQLMTDYLENSGVTLLIYSDASKQRMDGFCQYGKVSASASVVPLSCNDPLLSDSKRFLQFCLEHHIRGIYDCSALCIELLHTLREQIPGVFLIGTDTCSQMESLLAQQCIDIIIDQAPEQIGYQALASLYQYMRGGDRPTPVLNTPLRIITSECL